MKALDEIQSVIAQREDNYDRPEKMFSTIADMWASYLRVGRITPADVAAMMVLFKIARSTAGSNESTADDLLDAVGYAAFATDLRREQ